MRQVLQRSVDHIVEGAAIVLLFAIFEHYLTLNVIRMWLSEAEKDEYFAYRHIRHTIAHSADGTRARDHRAEFDRMYQAGKLQGVVLDTDTNMIDLSNSRCGIDCLSFMQNIAQKITARVAGSPTPEDVNWYAY